MDRGGGVGFQVSQSEELSTPGAVQVYAPPKAQCILGYAHVANLVSCNPRVFSFLPGAVHFYPNLNVLVFCCFICYIYIYIFCYLIHSHIPHCILLFSLDEMLQGVPLSTHI